MFQVYDISSCVSYTDRLYLKLNLQVSIACCNVKIIPGLGFSSAYKILFLEIFLSSCGINRKKKLNVGASTEKTLSFNFQKKKSGDLS